MKSLSMRTSISGLIMNIALTVVVVFLLFYIIRSGLNIQYSLLYYPSSSTPSVASLKANHLKLWRSFATDYRGVVAAYDSGQTTGTVVVFHGNGGIAADRTPYIDALAPLGYRVILAEYPMYGGRKGELGEQAFVKDGLETVSLAFEEYGEPFYILGESMGCGIAAAVAGKTSARIDGIILITPWDTLESLAREKFPFLPVRLLLKDQYDNIGNLRAFKGTIAVLGAGRDAVIPIGHAGNLYDSLSSTAKRMWLLQEAGHNDWLQFMNTAKWSELMNFISGKDKATGQQP
jgi:pimeloyl-ACP methyl ester carboxylesterase